MKSKGLKIILIILILLTGSAGGIGYVQSKKQNANNPNEEKNKITYEYYLEDELQETMPVNTPNTTDENGTIVVSEPTYQFSRFTCTDDLTGDFDVDNWKFIPKENKTSTCKLYFVKTNYTITLTITNGIEDENNPKTIQREKDGKFIIKPNEGYVYKAAVCSDNKEGSWDESTNTFTLNAIMKDITCKIDFEIKNLQADITVVNGKGNTTENANYGESISAIVQPNSGYEKAKIECTNNQSGTFTSNKFTIPKLTDNTKCTITFEKAPVVKHTLKINIADSTKYSISSGSESMPVDNGNDGVFSIKSIDGSKPTLSCGDINPSRIDNIDSNTYKYTFLNMTKDITCNIN